jgi:hypothetical protein
MQIASRLRDTTLGDLLAQLHREHASGVLELIEPRARHAIHLRRGFVQAVESESSMLRLGDVATRFWGIGRPLVERARMFAHARGIRMGHALVATQAIHPGQLDGLLAEQQRARLEGLYALQDAEIRFRVARPLPTGAAEQTPLEARETFYGRPRKEPREGSDRAENSAHTQSSHQGASGSRRQPRVTASRDAWHPQSNEYALLGLRPGCDEKSMRDAFRSLVMDLHPDRAHGLSDAERDARARRLVDVVRAYRSLTNAA